MSLLGFPTKGKSRPPPTIDHVHRLDGQQLSERRPRGRVNPARHLGRVQFGAGHADVEPPERELAEERPQPAAPPAAVDADVARFADVVQRQPRRRPRRGRAGTARLAALAGRRLPRRVLLLGLHDGILLAGPVQPPPPPTTTATTTTSQAAATAAAAAAAAATADTGTVPASAQTETVRRHQSGGQEEKVLHHRRHPRSRRETRGHRIAHRR